MTQTMLRHQDLSPSWFSNSEGLILLRTDPASSFADAVRTAYRDIAGPVRITVPADNTLPGSHLAVSTDGSRGNNLFYVRDHRPNPAGSTVQIQRISAAPSGLPNPKGLRVYCETQEGGDDGETRTWAISGEIVNSNSKNSVEGGTAVSGLSRRTVHGNGVLFGGHFQAADSTGGTNTRGLVGAEIGVKANHPDMNGNRIGLDVIAKTELADLPHGEMTAGVRIRNSRTHGGRWAVGALIGDSASPHHLKVGVHTANDRHGTAEASPALDVVGWLDTGRKRNAFKAEGTYSGPAIALQNNHRIGLGQRADGAEITLRYDPGSNEIQFFVGTTRKGRISMGPAGNDVLMNA